MHDHIASKTQNPSGKDEKSKKKVFGGRDIAFLLRRNEKECVRF